MTPFGGRQLLLRASATDLTLIVERRAPFQIDVADDAAADDTDGDGCMMVQPAIERR